jgi:hypothetical protein
MQKVWPAHSLPPSRCLMKISKKVLKFYLGVLVVAIGLAPKQPPD